MHRAKETAGKKMCYWALRTSPYPLASKWDSKYCAKYFMREKCFEILSFFDPLKAGSYQKIHAFRGWARLYLPTNAAQKYQRL
jgi:hypothetical protein